MLAQIALWFFLNVPSMPKFLEKKPPVFQEFHLPAEPSIAPVRKSQIKKKNKPIEIDRFTIPSKEEAQKIKDYICNKFGNRCAEALSVANAENGYFSPDRMSPTSDLGIFQVNKVHWKRFGKENLKDPYKNIDAGYQICLDAMAKGRDCLSPWTTYKDGTSKNYLEQYTGSGATLP